MVPFSQSQAWIKEEGWCQEGHLAIKKCLNIPMMSTIKIVMMMYERTRTVVSTKQGCSTI